MDAKLRRNLNRELLHLATEERKLRDAAQKARPAGWKRELEKKIPPKTYDGLVSAFSQGFSLVFKKGKKIIEVTYDKKNLKEQHETHRSHLEEGKRGVIKQMRSLARKSSARNMTATTAEGIALGLFGVGLPDIVLFLSTLLKGIYETALQYGFEYDSRREQYFILAMMKTALSTGSAWDRLDREVESLMTTETIAVTEEALNTQIRQTAELFAVDMLLLKFIQGMPVVGFLGGAANPVYYRKVMQYVLLKYRKRYLQNQLQEGLQ